MKWKRIFFSTIILFVGSLSIILAQEIQITSAPYDYGLPRWSPDGKWIVYDREDETEFRQIYKVSNEGGIELPLTNENTDHTSPEWSPVGNWICYEKKIINQSDTIKQIYKIKSDGIGEVALTKNGKFDRCSPVWSPDEKWITYYKRDSLNLRTQIYKVSSDGSGNEIQLTSDEWDCNMPSWSPDGFWIIYQKRDSILENRTGVWRLYKAAATGGKQIRLTDIKAMHEGPHWSTQNDWIVYEFRYLDVQYARSQIYKVSPLGGDEIQLTSHLSMHESPRISPDGKWITYERRDTLPRQIYRISIDGGVEIALTAMLTNHYRPEWSPDGKWIAYLILTKDGYQIYKVRANIETNVSDKFTTSNEFYLHENFPNPFSQHTTIRFQIFDDRSQSSEIRNQKSEIVLKVYDLFGREITTLIDDYLEPEEHTVNFDLRPSHLDLPNGIYFYRLTTSTQSQTRKMILYR